MNLLDDQNTSQEKSDTVFDSPQNNFGLSYAEYSSMVEKLKSGKEELFEKVFLSQFGESVNYLKNNYKIDHETAYDVTMNTLIDFRSKIINNKIVYGNLRYLFTKMATQYYLKDVEKVNRSIGLNSLTMYEQDETYIEEKLAALKNAWDELPQNDKQLLEEYYCKDIPLIKIAEMQNKTDAALRKQKQRCIEKLRSIFFNKYEIKA